MNASDVEMMMVPPHEVLKRHERPQKAGNRANTNTNPAEKQTHIVGIS